VRRWWPERAIIAVADSDYAALRLLARCQALCRPITVITRLRLDAALYDPAPSRQPHQNGRPRKKGARLPTLVARAADPVTAWTPLTVTQWYGERERTVEIVSETALWYHAGQSAMVRWVLMRDPHERFATQALLCTDLTVPPGQIIAWFVRRWQMETTLAEVR